MSWTHGAGMKWDEVESLFNRGVELPPGERDALLAGCQPDTAQAVRVLWAANDQAGDFLGIPAVSLDDRHGLEKGELIANRFRVIELIGAGGMGEVFLGRDEQLGRTVALKTLAQVELGRPDSVRRLEGEARAVCSLNHPQICSLHDLIWQDGLPVLVMEHLKGETLGSRLARGPLPNEELLRVALGIASGLGYAHASGVVHRDLKPANVMLTDAGVKLLDFGIATRTGASEAEAAGSAGYMSPEQAQGKPVDARSDIFAFGALLYEMATGRAAFQAKTRCETLTAIRRSEPEALLTIAPGCPRGVDAVVRRCLRKSPSERYQSVSELLADLTRLAKRRDRFYRNLLIAACIVVLVGGVASWRLIPTQKDSDEAEVRQISDESSDNGWVGLSPDGTSVVYSTDRGGNPELWLKKTSGGEPIQLTNDPAIDLGPTFSPNGKEIVFWSSREGGGIYIIPATGGNPRRLVGATGAHHPDFSPDGSHLAYRNGAGIFVVSTAGGEPRRLGTDVYSILGGPVFLPDGKDILFLGHKASEVGVVNVYAAPVEGGPSRKTELFQSLEREGVSIIDVFGWHKNDLIFLGQSGNATNLWYAPIDLRNFQLAGKAHRLVSGGTQVAASVMKEQVAYVSQDHSNHIMVVPIDLNYARVLGEMNPVVTRNKSIYWAAISPDGAEVMFTSTGATPTVSLYGKNLDAGQERAVSVTSHHHQGPIFLKDGRLLFGQFVPPDTESIWLLNPGGRSPLPFYANCPDFSASKEGRWLVCRGRIGQEAHSGKVIDTSTRQEAEILYDSQSRLHGFRISPDDQWIAFLSLSGGRERLYVAPFRRLEKMPQEEWIAVTDGKSWAGEPEWSPDGSILYYPSRGDGFGCIWAQRLEPRTKRLVGKSIGVVHLHNRIFFSADQLSLSLTASKLAFIAQEKRYSIWLTRFPKGR